MAAQIETASELSSVPVRLRIAWRMGRRFVLWLKALTSLAVLVLSAFADQYNVADVVGFIKSAFADSTRLSIIVAVVAVVFVTLKTVLKLPKGFSAKNTLDDGE